MVAYLVNRDRVAWRVVDDEAVIIHSETSDYFSLNRSGTWLWSLLELPRSRNDLAAALSARYGRPAAEASADVDAYLENLVTTGLLLHDTEAAAIAMSAGSADAAAPRDGYEAPQVVKFGNLETLILSGE